jgi:hypothetical protein
VSLNTPSPTLTLSNASLSHTSFDHPAQTPKQHHSDLLKYPAEVKHVLVNALLAAATSFFPTYLSDAIKRIPDPDNENALVADISMIFPRAPYTGKFGCQMALVI